MKWWRRHETRPDFAVCKACTGKTPLEIAEQSEVCPFCKNRKADDRFKKMLEDHKIDTEGALDRINK